MTDPGQDELARLAGRSVRCGRGVAERLSRALGFPSGAGAPTVQDVRWVEGQMEVTVSEPGRPAVVLVLARNDGSPCFVQTDRLAIRHKGDAVGPAVMDALRTRARRNLARVGMEDVARLVLADPQRTWIDSPAVAPGPEPAGSAGAPGAVPEAVAAPVAVAAAPAASAAPPPLASPAAFGPDARRRPIPPAELRVGFITPSVFVEMVGWHRSSRALNLAAPSVSGALRAAGFPRIRQYEFESALPLAAQQRPPGFLDLEVFADRALVDRFLAADEPSVRKATDVLFEVLGIEPADLFGLSCTNGCENDEHLARIENIALCLAKCLKERFGAAVVVGGIRNERFPVALGRYLELEYTALEEIRAEYRTLLARCPWLDAAVDGPGEGPLLLLARSLCDAAPLTPAEGVEVEALATGQVFLHPELEPRGDPLLFHFPPWFDPANVALRRSSGRALLERFRFDDEHIAALRPHHDRPVGVLPLMFLQGCGRGCIFCRYAAQRVLHAEPADIVRALGDLRDRHGIRNFLFINSAINVRTPFVERFLDELIAARLDIQWTDSATMAELDEPLLAKLRRSGCVRLVMGVETPSERMVRYVRKRITVARIKELIRATHELGMMNHLDLISGMAHETPADVAEFLDFFDETRDWVDGYQVSMFYLDPYSPLARHPERHGVRIRSKQRSLGQGYAFDEPGGLDWEARHAAGLRSTAEIIRHVVKIKGYLQYVNDFNAELVFFLYEVFGHDRKADVIRHLEHAWAREVAFEAASREAVPTGSNWTEMDARVLRP